MVSLPVALAALAGVLAAVGAGGVIAGITVDSWLNLRDLRRTGHVSACSAPAWSCTCPAP